MLEQLESRTLHAVVIPPVEGPGFTPAQVAHAYGFDAVQFQAGGETVAGDGRGQTIAIVSAFRAPAIRDDLKAFDRQYGLLDKLPSGHPVLKVDGQLAGRKQDATWQLETALDVEWAHAIAPAAQILLVQARSDSQADLFKAVNRARSQRGVSVVSMSWGWDSTPVGIDFKSLFSTPARHQGALGKGDGVTFVEAAADNGAANAFPDSSINVVSVGGTELTLNGSDYESETALPSSISPAVVAYAANGFSIYHAGVWTTAGGTSAAAPQWAALFAIANQGRAIDKKHALDGATQTLTGTADVSGDDFHVIPGSTAAMGRGSPFADRLIDDLIAI